MDPWAVLVLAATVVGGAFFALYLLYTFRDTGEMGFLVVVEMGIPGVVGGVLGVIATFLLGPSVWAWLNCGPGDFHFRGPPCMNVGDACVPIGDGASPLLPVGNVCNSSGLLVTTIGWELLAFAVAVAIGAGAILVWLPWQLIRGRPVRDFE